MIPLRHLVLGLAFAVASVFAAELQPPQLEDLYKTDVAVDPITLANGRLVIYVRQRVDPETRSLKQSLWFVDDKGGPRPMEEGEPDAFSPMLSPDGRWIVFLSSRPFADGAPAFAPVPPYSDPAADIWFLPVSGGKAIPLGGKAKPYGRVITDKFYGRIAFSPDGRKLAFIADDGRDPRTEAENRNHVIIVRDDQGEGFEGYGPMQLWVADLGDQPANRMAANIARLTTDDFWYGDPQWSPDGSFIVVHANRTAEQESVRYSINHNYDLWKIALSDRRIEQLTMGPGPEFSPRLSPDGKRLVCLSSPRKGPHMDVFNLMMVDLDAGAPASRLLVDHHAASGADGSSPFPSNPLPDRCWLDDHRIWFNTIRGVKSLNESIDVHSGNSLGEHKPAAAIRSPLLPKSNPTLPARLRAEDEIVRWKSFDGLEIEGVLTRPPASIVEPPFRLLVMPHGGPHSRAGGGGFDAQFFATRGFAVFRPNFRGSIGYGLKFLDADRNDFGGGDMKDILTGIDYLVAQGIADPGRQFVYGVSYGGYMASWLVGHTNQFRAAVAQNAVTDLQVMWHLSDLQSWTDWDMSGKPWEVPDRLRAHSPLTFANQVRTPTLILHSLNDRRCPVAMGRMFHRALKEGGVETQMVIYPDEGHPIKQLPHREDVLQRTLEWFEKHDQPPRR